MAPPDYRNVYHPAKTLTKLYTAGKYPPSPRWITDLRCEDAQSSKRKIPFAKKAAKKKTRGEV